MKKTLLLILFSSTIFFSQNESDSTFGSLFIIGGGSRPDYMMKEFVDMAGGDKAKIIVVPMASSEPVETGKYQSEQFIKFGASADYILIDEKNYSESVLQKFNGATGVFFSGGDQRRLTERLLGTKILDIIKEIFEEGGVIGGTSAGAAVMSSIMITGDEEVNKEDEKFIDIRQKNIITTKGFGFIKNAIIDQHFLYRKRHNRLISVVLEHPELIGIGIDESTAIILNSNDSFEVLGENQVVVYSTNKKNIINTNDEGLFVAGNIKTDILTSGWRYDITNKTIVECN